MTPCLTDAALQEMLAERLAPQALAEGTAHLDECAACRARLETLAAGDVVPAARSDKSATPAPVPPRLAEVMRNLKTAVGVTKVGTRPSPPLSLAFLKPSDKPELLGLFGRYEITSLLGHGGMGVVLQGVDPTLRREVAIKVLLPHWAAQPEMRERFLREARGAAAVVHDNVVALHEVGEAEGLPYLVMPCIAGESLQDRLDRDGALPIDEIARIGAEIAAGLAAAHAKGLIHRDIKPSNILLEGPARRVKISDFGLAKATDDASLTQSGVLAGTPEYMAPEQASGGPIDARADLFALGSVLYAMASGHSPFRGDSTYAVIRRVCEGTPASLTTLRPELPAWFVAIVERLLSKNPSDRFATADEVAASLRAGDDPSAAAKPAKLFSVPTLLVGGTLALAALIVPIATLWWLNSGNPNASPARPVVAADKPMSPAEAPAPPEKEPELPWHKPPIVKPPGFYVRSNEQAYPTLAEAVAAAKEDDWIEIHGDGPHVTKPIKIEGKSLIIHAADGAKPVFVSENGDATPNAPFIETTDKGIVVLSGLDIRWLSKPRRPSDVDAADVLPHSAILARNYVRLTSCRVTVAGVNCCVAVHGGSCQFEDSMLVSPAGPAVLAHLRKGEISGIHSIVVGKVAISTWVDDDSIGGGKLEVWLKQCTISTSMVFQCFAVGSKSAELPTDDTPRLVASAESTVFDAPNFLVLRPAPFPNAPGAPKLPPRSLGKLTNQADWSGNRNVFSGVTSYVALLRGGRPQVDLTKTFDDWKKKTGADEHSLATTVEFAAAGARRDPDDFALAAVPGLEEYLLTARGADVRKVGPGRQLNERMRELRKQRESQKP